MLHCHGNHRRVFHAAGSLLRPLCFGSVSVIVFLGSAVAVFAQSDSLIKYSSPTVRLYTDIEAEAARTVLEKLEFYRSFISVFFQEHGVAQKKENPLRCHLFANRDDFLQRRKGEFTLREPCDAYFSPGNNRIVAFYDEGSPRAYAALLRQSARPLIRDFLSNSPPAWCEEGLACYFEGMVFDEANHRISACGEFSRLEAMRDLVLDERFLDWKRFFDERPLAGDFEQKTGGANTIHPPFSAQAWGVFFFYLESADESAREAIDHFLHGLQTGRVRSEYIMDDLQKRMEKFHLFFFMMHEENLTRYNEAVRLRERKDTEGALKALLKILETDPNHVATLRLAGIVAWEGGRYAPALSFFRLLAEWEPENVFYLNMICRCLVESGLQHGNTHTLEEAVETGKEAVKASNAKDADCLAALAKAYDAIGNPQEALKTIRKAVWLGGPSVETHRELEKRYSETLREHYKDSKTD
ncbi:MAG: tetratricopeptide repeat protein [Planctomycetes bacterium]|nr:tetratricopeptide repeat protein [Planctomycetota bacterium]